MKRLLFVLLFLTVPASQAVPVFEWSPICETDYTHHKLTIQWTGNTVSRSGGYTVIGWWMNHFETQVADTVRVHQPLGIPDIYSGEKGPWKWRHGGRVGVHHMGAEVTIGNETKTCMCQFPILTPPCPPGQQCDNF